VIFRLALETFKRSPAFKTVIILTCRNAHAVHESGVPLALVASIFGSTQITVDIIANKVADTAHNYLPPSLALSANVGRTTGNTIMICAL
jgi:hypothetical protein